jgi:hypothetical protein
MARTYLGLGGAQAFEALVEELDRRILQDTAFFQAIRLRQGHRDGANTGPIGRVVRLRRS